MEFYKKNAKYQIWASEIQKLEAELEGAKETLEKLVDDPDVNRFESADEAFAVLDDKFLDRAKEACEGSYNVGEESYRQECFIDGVPFLYILTPEYNRHDRQYYYVESWDSELEPKKSEISKEDLEIMLATVEPNSKIEQLMTEFKEIKGW